MEFLDDYITTGSNSSSSPNDDEALGDDADLDDMESPYFIKCKQYTSQLLAHHLWPLTDSVFEAEVTKTITKAPVQDASLKIGPVVGGVASSNAHPLVKQAIKLLSMYENCMPKERSVSELPSSTGFG